MSIPTYEQVMIPVLKFIEDGDPKLRREIVSGVADALGLTDEDRATMLPSGQVSTIASRVGWAITYLKQAGVISSPSRAVYQITDRGRAVLKDSPDGINSEYLLQYPEFREFKQRTRNAQRQPDESISTDEHYANERRVAISPEEALDAAYAQIRAGVEEELLDAVKAASPPFFERLVVDLLVRMGYGGSREDAARAVGRAGDGGIDGVIDEDRLGLDAIYIQAKRWDGAVGRPELQKFAGALQGQRARKGIFITTSFFTKEAQEYASRIDTRIVLIDGHRLAALMYEFDTGVNPSGTYTIKRLDGDYFEA